jgi:hypothetical protein
MSGGTTIAGCTIIAKNQISSARVLAQSWRSHHPDSSFFVLLLDSPTGFFRPEREAFQIIPLNALQIRNLSGFLFRYGRGDAANAAKPFFFLHLLDRESVKDLVYLAPEIFVLGPMNDLSNMLDGADVVITGNMKHFLTRDSGAQAEGLSGAGDYLPRLVALRDSINTRRVLRWW